MQNKQTTDFLIIGGGVIGLCMALEAKRRHPAQAVTVIEKELELAFHASGRNSGVLHAGFYYTADSLKAKFTREGCARWKEYCRSKNIKMNECGKLVVAKNTSELAGLEELYKRGKINGVELHEISADEAKKIEPRIKTCQKALFSPTTASVNPKDVINSLLEDAQKLKIRLLTDTQYIKRVPKGIQTNKGLIEAEYIINAAGLYADKIAKDFGFSQNYKIIPFKGLYLYSNEKIGSVKTNIYPVPNLHNPFLGVHYTLTVDGKIKIGPTAIPAFWREHYEGFKRFNLNECVEIVASETKLFLSNSFNFRNLAFEEIKKYSRKKMVELASYLLEGVYPENYTTWGKPGIRAQLLDTSKNKLEMDFKYEGDSKSFHVLNAVSPAFTCALPFSEFLFNKIDNLANGKEMN